MKTNIHQTHWLPEQTSLQMWNQNQFCFQSYLRSNWQYRAPRRTTLPFLCWNSSHHSFICKEGRVFSNNAFLPKKPTAMGTVLSKQDDSVFTTFHIPVICFCRVKGKHTNLHSSWSLTQHLMCSKFNAYLQKGNGFPVSKLLNWTACISLPIHRTLWMTQNM